MAKRGGRTSDRLLYDGQGIRVTLEAHRVIVRLSLTGKQSFVFPWNEVACALAEVHVEGACDRCRQPIADFRPPEGSGMTAGYSRRGVMAMGKLWAWDSDDKHWVRIRDGVRISDVDLKLYEKDNHSSLRGVTGDDRLEGCLAAQKPSVTATPSADAASLDAGEQPNEVVDGDGDVLANPMLREALGLDGKNPKDWCMVCGAELHNGKCIC